MDAAPLLFLFLALVVFWLLVMRPARTQQRKIQRLQAELEVGQEVVLSAGIFGTIRSLDDARAEIEIAPGTVIMVARQVVVRRAEELPDTDSDAAPADEVETGPDRPTDRPTDRRDDAPGTPGQA